MENALKERKEELIKINAEKDKFFSILAHDLRNPIGNFIGLTELIKNDAHNYSLDELENIAERMNSSANNLFLLLTNLLDWSMVKRGIITLNAVNLNLFELFESCYNSNDDIFENKKIVYEMNVHADLNVAADENMIKTIIRNLITNAVKFSNENDKVSLTAKMLNDGTVEICVSDSGIGMDKELLDNLFILDKNVQRIGTANERSTGLGLILCKEFVEMHNGKIWVESTEGKGSKFFFTINTHFDLND
jgi:signal transduction histidine kinase